MFTCDNGTAGYGKGRVEQEKGARVPLIVNCPGLVRGLGPTDELVQFADILPTLADLANADFPEGYVLDGRSFAPLLRGDEYRGRDWIFSYYATHRMLRDRRWLLDGRGRLYDCGDGRDETGYEDVTESQAPEVAEAKGRFERILADLPGPPDDMVRRWEERQARKRARERGRKAGGR